MPRTLPVMREEELKVLEIIKSGVLLYKDRATSFHFIIVPLHPRTKTLGRRPRFIRKGIFESLWEKELLRIAPAYTDDRYVAYRASTYVNTILKFYRNREKLKVELFRKMGGKPEERIIEKRPKVPNSQDGLQAGIKVAEILVEQKEIREEKEKNIVLDD